MEIRAIKTSIFEEGQNLVDFIVKHIPQPQDNSVLVVTSKIVALSEGRTSGAADAKTKEELIKKESQFAIETKYAWLTIKDGQVMASAGIDESNANGKLILLPKDSYKTAEQVRNILKEKYGLKNFGVLITDSRTVPLRSGIVGMALGFAGFRGIKDYRGKPDIFGRPFHFSKTDMADSLAAAAVLVMGEGAEQQPLAIITDAPIEFCETVSPEELNIDPKEDMYRPLFDKLSKE